MYNDATSCEICALRTGIVGIVSTDSRHGTDMHKCKVLYQYSVSVDGCKCTAVYGVCDNATISCMSYDAIYASEIRRGVSGSLACECEGRGSTLSWTIRLINESMSIASLDDGIHRYDTCTCNTQSQRTPTPPDARELSATYGIFRKRAKQKARLTVFLVMRARPRAQPHVFAHCCSS